MPRWFKLECLIWLCTGLPLQWFFTAFNGLPFFSLPDAPGPNGSPLFLYLIALIVLYHPIFMLPVAIWNSRRKVTDA